MGRKESRKKRAVSAATLTEMGKEITRMKSYRKYNTKEDEKKVFTVVWVIILLALIVLCVLTITGVFDKAIWEPDISFPIANANISWEQTFFPGGFGG